MNRESVALGIAGVFFGLLIGWIVGSQSGARVPAAVPAPAAAPSAAAPGPGGGQQTPPPFDQRRADELTRKADAAPRDAAIRAQLGNLYFDAERYPEAIRWYQASLDLDARNTNVSTDLGVAYYYANQSDRALAQFDHSLAIDPGHAKTLLNLGVVRAFGKQDLAGATEAWQKVIARAPDSAEGRAARQMIEAVRSAHPESAPAQTPPAGSPSAPRGM
jgi:cytochrome c-type biogenesis protein CcmH/NrfG